jgi:histidinol-phosphate phosphatase family protein
LTPSGRPAVFLDRDGTLIHDRHYLADPAGVELLPGAAQAVARLNAAGYFVVLVTNQSGIGRGYFGEAEYQAVHRRLVDLLAADGARLDADYHCPLAPDDPDPEQMRKPGAGMFLRGDRLRDVAPAARLGARAILVRSEQTDVAGGDREVTPLLPGITEAVDLVLTNSTVTLPMKSP